MFAHYNPSLTVLSQTKNPASVEIFFGSNNANIIEQLKHSNLSLGKNGKPPIRKTIPVEK